MGVGREPRHDVDARSDVWGLGATIPVEADAVWALGLSAILEEKDGTKSYWALAHPPGDKPDFHAADCFAASLP